jgi:hypothetical protein
VEVIMKTKELKRFHRSLSTGLPFRQWVRSIANVFQNQRHFTQTGSLIPDRIGEACIHWLEHKRINR